MISRTSMSVERSQSSVLSDYELKELRHSLQKIDREIESLNEKKPYDFAREEKRKSIELLERENIPFLKQTTQPLAEDKADRVENTDLLLTDGRLDMDKIVCLHVLTVSQPESCTQRIVKSNSTVELTRYSKYLPSYLMENEGRPINCSCWARNTPIFTEKPIEIHLKVNRKIEKMIHTAINVLKSVNPRKLNDLCNIMRSTEAVNSVLKKPETQIFLNAVIESKLLQNDDRFEIRHCTLQPGKTQLIYDDSKFKKNIVFRIDVPQPTAEIRSRIFQPGKYTHFTTPCETEVFSPEEHRVTKEKANTNSPGYKLIQKGSSAGGLAVIGSAGSKVSYWKSKVNSVEPSDNLTILMRSPDITDHDYVIEKMSEHNTIVEPKNRIEKMCLKIAKRNMGKKTSLTDDTIYEELKATLLKKLTNEQRLEIAKKVAAQKGTEDNSESDGQSLPLVELLKGTVDRYTLIKLLRELSDFEREVLFKQEARGGVSLGELLLDDRKLANFGRMRSTRANESNPKTESQGKFKHKISSPAEILKMEYRFSKEEVAEKCRTYMNKRKVR